MNYIGRWKFDSIAALNENDEYAYINAEEYLKSPMPYIDETDKDEVENEINERKRTIGIEIDICENGEMYMLMPLPEGVTQEQIDEAVNSGEIKLYDGMLTDKPGKWEERDGELWSDLGVADEPLHKVSNDEGYLSIMTMRFKKAASAAPNLAPILCN